MNLSEPLDLDPTDREDGEGSLTGEGRFPARALLEVVDGEPPVIYDGAERHGRGAAEDGVLEYMIGDVDRFLWRWGMATGGEGGLGRR
jgi:hypothetical protein